MPIKVTVVGAAEPPEIEVYADGCDYGVDIGDGFVITCIDEEDARIRAHQTGGEFVARDVYVTAWAKV
jgi:hypothetical protein